MYFKAVAFMCLGLFLGSCSFSQNGERGEALSIVLNIRRPKTLSNLKGKSEEEMVALLGAPQLKRMEEPYQSWVYKTYDCVLFVFFDEKKEASYTQTRGICQKSIAGYQLSTKNAS